MTWTQLDELQRTGLFEVQSHTFWHPNFKIERRQLAPPAFRTFVTTQFGRSRAVLEARLGVRPVMLAWPFGIYDDELIELAREAG
jgi:hypothetical protein